MKVFVTGAAGFIGSNMVDRCLAEGWDVVGYDNFSTGRRRFLEPALSNKAFSLIEGDLLNTSALDHAMADCDWVFHLAANADVRFGLEHPGRDLEQNTLATFNVLEAMRANGVKRIAFSSTGSVYGEATVIPTPEDAPFPVQTSLYGASKLAGEALIQAYAEGFGYTAVIFRFVSMLGERYTHGHIVDFCKQLRKHPERLRVLGDGTQRKSYLAVSDGITAWLRVAGEQNAPRMRIYNLGADEYCQVTDSIGWIADELGLAPKLEFTGGDRGWVGDNPFIFLDTARIRATGWAPKLTIEQGVRATVRFLRDNPWVLDTP